MLGNIIKQASESAKKQDIESSASSEFVDGQVHVANRGSAKTFKQSTSNKDNKNQNLKIITPIRKKDSPGKKSQSNNLISQILDHQVYRQKNLNPEFLRIKNNILLLILIGSFFGIYYLFEEFLDVMLLAFIGGNFLFDNVCLGVGYQQMQDRFISFWQSDKPFFQKKMSLAVRISSIFGYLGLFVLLPWIRNMLGNPQEISTKLDISNLTLSSVIQLLSFKPNPVVIIVQIFLLLRILHLILAPEIFPIIAPRIPQNAKFYKVLFSMVFVVITISSISIIPSVLLMEVSYGGFWMQAKVEQHLGCQVISYSTHNDQKMPFCSQMLFNNNTFFEQTFKEFKYICNKQFRAQTSDIQECMTYIQGLQKDIIGYEIFHYEELVCTWYLIIQKASLYFAPQAGVFSTGTTLFKTVFGNISFVISSLSNIIFSLTTFLTIFYMTIRYFDSRSTVIQEIFFGERKQLLSQITNLIQATIYIVVEHFAMSIILLELFNFSYFNMIIATLLSSMAFVPFFRPWFGALFFSLIRSIFLGNVIVNIIFVVIYYYMSETIFSSRFKQMQFHEIITNMSILFGIYQFGVAGIFYGPIIMILFKSVHRELLRNQVYQTEIQRGDERDE